MAGRFTLSAEPTKTNYVLDEQVGYLLRKASQRHTGIFANLMPKELTPTRFAALAKLYERGPVSQNELGRLTSMDVATIKGVVDRLRSRDLVVSARHKDDGRRQVVSLTAKGAELVERVLPVAAGVTGRTMSTLSDKEQRVLVQLLAKIS